MRMLKGWRNVEEEKEVGGQLRLGGGGEEGGGAVGGIAQLLLLLQTARSWTALSNHPQVKK